MCINFRHWDRLMSSYKWEQVPVDINQFTLWLKIILFLHWNWEQQMLLFFLYSRIDWNGYSHIALVTVDKSNSFCVHTVPRRSTIVRTMLKIFLQIIAQLSHKSRNFFLIKWEYYICIMSGVLKHFKRLKQREEENVWKRNMVDFFLAFQLLLQLYVVMCVS